MSLTARSAWAGLIGRPDASGVYLLADRRPLCGEITHHSDRILGCTFIQLLKTLFKCPTISTSKTPQVINLIENHLENSHKKYVKKIMMVDYWPVECPWGLAGQLKADRMLIARIFSKK